MKKPRAAPLVRAVVLLCAAAGMLPGGLDRRFDLTLERVLNGGPPVYDPPFLLADLMPRDARRFTDFSGDLSGRYIGALAAASPHRPVPAEALRELVHEALGLQRSDGHFGAPLSRFGVADDDMALMWGNGRLLVGLLEYHAVSHDAEALRAARGIGDFLSANAEKFNSAKVRRDYGAGRMAHGYICWTQNIEGLVALGRAAADARYIETAAAIAGHVSQQPGQHSHGLLSSLRGILELYRETGDAQWLRQVEEAWSKLAASGNVAVTGTVCEYLEPAMHRDEGCSVADWLRLSLALWRETQKPRYIAAAERSWFNGFAMNQFAGGDFGHVYFNANGFAGGADRAWWCCTLHGLRAFPAVAEAAFRETEDALLYEFAVDAAVASGGLRVRAAAGLDIDSTVELEIEAAPAEPRAIGVRIPAWANDAALAVNGNPAAATREDGYALLERVWAAGDRLRAYYELRAESLLDRNRPGRRALLLGPWVMAVSEAEEPAFFDEGYAQNEADIDDLAAVEGLPARRELRYVHAGYREQAQTARLLPVGERTWSARQGRWEVWLRSGDAAGAAEKAAARLPQPEQAPLPFLAGAAAIAAACCFLWLRRRRSAGR